MIEDNFTNKGIEQIENLKNTHSFVSEELDYIKSLHRVKAVLTPGYKIETAPKIEVYISEIHPTDKARILKAVDKAVADEIRQIITPSVNKILAALEALYG